MCPLKLIQGQISLSWSSKYAIHSNSLVMREVQELNIRTGFEKCCLQKSWIYFINVWNILTSHLTSSVISESVFLELRIFPLHLTDAENLLSFWKLGILIHMGWGYLHDYINPIKILGPRSLVSFPTSYTHHSKFFWRGKFTIWLVQERPWKLVPGCPQNVLICVFPSLLHYLAVINFSCMTICLDLQANQRVWDFSSQMSLWSVTLLLISPI